MVVDQGQTLDFRGGIDGRKMLDKPSKIKVGPFDYTVEFVDAEWVTEHDLQGRIDYRKRIISIYANRPDIELADTFLHEVMHALLHHYNRIHLEEPMRNEDIAEWLSSGLVMVWRDNPDALAWCGGMINNA